MVSEHNTDFLNASVEALRKENFRLKTENTLLKAIVENKINGNGKRK
jgi:hypothetical protein|tara:strand:+ start:483 stop:623 length:141 start_codon:yes stop_codon:yes gene_type:complete